MSTGFSTEPSYNHRPERTIRTPPDCPTTRQSGCSGVAPLGLVVFEYDNHVAIASICSPRRRGVAVLVRIVLEIDRLVRLDQTGLNLVLPELEHLFTGDPPNRMPDVDERKGAVATAQVR